MAEDQTPQNTKESEKRHYQDAAERTFGERLTKKVVFSKAGGILTSAAVVAATAPGFDLGVKETFVALGAGAITAKHVANRTDDFRENLHEIQGKAPIEKLPPAPPSDEPKERIDKRGFSFIKDRMDYLFHLNHDRPPKEGPNRLDRAVNSVQVNIGRIIGGGTGALTAGTAAAMLGEDSATTLGMAAVAGVTNKLAKGGVETQIENDNLPELAKKAADKVGLRKSINEAEAAPASKPYDQDQGKAPPKGRSL